MANKNLNKAKEAKKDEFYSGITGSIFAARLYCVIATTRV